MNDKINVTVENGVKELVIREGKANDVREPVKLSLTGNIKAPGQFLEKRKKLFGIYDGDNAATGTAEVLHKIHECNVIVDRRKNSIVLNLNERDERGTLISGKLSVNPDLIAFGINNATQIYGLKELIKMLRHKRVFFADAVLHSDLINSLSNFTASQTTDLELKNDRRGNEKILVDKKTSLTIPFSFKLAMPLYDGFEKKEFFVDVLVDVSDASAQFFLESVDLSELLVTERDRIFDEQLKLFSDFVVVEV